MKQNKKMNKLVFIAFKKLKISIKLKIIIKYFRALLKRRKWKNIKQINKIFQ